MRDEDKRQLLDYLSTARDLEAMKMELKRIRDDASRGKNVLVFKSYPDPTLPYVINNEQIPAKIGDALKNGAEIGAFLGFALGVLVCFESSNAEYYSYVAGPPLCAAIVGAAGAVIGIVFESIRSIVKNAQLVLLNDRHERENRLAEKQWQEITGRAKKRDAAAVKEIQKDIANLDYLVKAVELMLAAHYENGPIYYKYQTFSAICQLHEYFDSGRFSELGDAYNQYELEKRLDKIIESQDEALRLLKQIRDNQYLLYQELQRIKTSVDSMNSKLRTCVEKLDTITYAQEMNVLCARQTAAAATLLAQIQLNKNDLPFEFEVYKGYLLEESLRLMARKREIES